MSTMCVGLLAVWLSTAAAEDSGRLLTVAERSDYRATARYAEVGEIIDRLARRSPVVRVASMGRSFEGRGIPLIILADPPVSTPKQAVASGKLVVLALGSIHAGEICGKEALLMLAREVGTTPDHPLLRDLVIVFAPIFNPDGNERVSKDNRPNQNGPAEGVGQRHNAQDLDLNRDYVKLETPEVRALVRFLNEWDPALIIDTHTTNGSHHQYTLTFAGPRIGAGDQRIIEFVRDTMLPEVSGAVERATGYKTFYYGNFNRERTAWVTYPPLPRYGTPYRGLRNRIAILSEAHAYAEFRDRVLVTRAFVEQCLRYVARHKSDVRRLLADADRRTIEAGNRSHEGDRVGIRHELAPFPEKVRIEGFVEREVDGRLVPTDEPKVYEIDRVAVSKPSLSVRRPYAYLLPASLANVVENLQHHGIKVERLSEPVELPVEVYTICKAERAERGFQGHHAVRVEADSHVAARRFERGTIVIRTGQKLGALAVYLLEPQSEDGLCTWGFFDDVLGEGADFPVARVLEATDMPFRALPRRF